MKYFGLSGAIALSAVLMSGCCGGNRACSVPEELLVARDSVCAYDSSADVSIVFDAPLDKSLPLSAAVGEYFSEVLGGSYQDDSRDFKAAAQYYFDARLESSREFFREYLEESGMEGGAGCYDKIEFVKDSESPSYLTYRFSEYSYSGGAHGSTVYRGVTFRKSDGRRIGWDVVAPDVYSEELQSLISDGLRDYWGLSAKDDLREYLFDNAVWSVPLPQCPPLFESDGVRFIYNEYEIAAYASGRPTFVIPYEDMKPFMMVTARRLIQQ